MSDLSITLEFETGTQTWRQVLLDAARKIERHGHWKAGTPSKGVCAITAMPECSYMGEACERLEAVLGRSITGWNDDPKTSTAEVIRTLREVATS